MYKVLAHGATNVGCVRKNNEDTFRLAPDAGLFLVCDGMGGHASGEVASQIAADAMVRFVALDRHRPDFEWPAASRHMPTEEARTLDAAVRQANLEVYVHSLGHPAHKGMGTTIVSLLAGTDALGVVHVGDSRIYRMRDRELEQVTDDHSLLNHYMRTRAMTAEQISTFQGKNVIVRAVGLHETVEPEVQSIPYRAGDLYLLCTDGLTDMVGDEQIAEVLRDRSEVLQEGTDELIRLALEAGGKDNVSVLLARIIVHVPVASHRRKTEPYKASFGDTSPGFDVRKSAFSDTMTGTSPTVRPRQPNWGFARTDIAPPRPSSQPVQLPDSAPAPQTPTSVEPTLRMVRPFAKTPVDGVKRVRANDETPAIGSPVPRKEDLERDPSQS